MPCTPAFVPHPSPWPWSPRAMCPSIFADPPVYLSNLRFQDYQIMERGASSLHHEHVVDSEFMIEIEIFHHAIQFMGFPARSRGPSFSRKSLPARGARRLGCQVACTFTQGARGLPL